VGREAAALLLGVAEVDVGRITDEVIGLVAKPWAWKP
jgi:hypothetical protein